MLACRRDITRLPDGLQGISLDHTRHESLVRLSGVDYGPVVMTPTPTSRDVEGYRRGFLLAAKNLLQLWQDDSPRELLFVSSTRVYGDCAGEWVDEETVAQPADAQGELILAAEQALLESHHRVTVIRFSGIYGRQPSRLLQRLQKGIITGAQPHSWSNRIHREDCIACLRHLLDLDGREPLYLGTDSEPVQQRRLEEWLLQRLGVEATEEQTPRSAASRRCLNRRLLNSGFEFSYPDYRAGYSAMITSTSIPTPLGSAAT